MVNKIDLQNLNELPKTKAKKVAQKKVTEIHREIADMSREELATMFENLELHKIELELQNEELQNTQDKLKDSKQKYFDLYDLAPVGYLTINHEDLITEVNLSGSSMLDDTKDSITKKRLSSFIDKEDQDKYYLFHKKIVESGQKQSSNMKIFRKDGTDFWVFIVGSPADNHYDKASINIVLSDITELKEAQNEITLKDKQMIAQSKLAQMGEMISMIAHQWRQPLSTISMGVSNILVDIELNKIDENALKKHANRIADTTQELSKTINDFRDFYKPDKQLATLRLDDIFEKALNIIKPSLVNNNITMVKESNSDENIELYDREVMQVVLNILNNAKDNFQEKQIKNRTIIVKIKNRAISICDNAGGIPADIIDKIFDPYFSTKDEKNGTGLGLYMSKIIVENHHNGKLSAQNVDNGVCFTIELGIVSKKDQL